MSAYPPYLCYDAAMPEKGIDWDKFEADNSVVSPGSDFLFDASNVDADPAALQTESTYPTALEFLTVAGMDKYLVEHRTQFADYLETNPHVLG